MGSNYLCHRTVPGDFTYQLLTKTNTSESKWCDNRLKRDLFQGYLIPETCCIYNMR